MSLYEFTAAVTGYAKIKGGKADPMTDEEFEAGLEEIRALNLPDVRV